MTWNATDLEAIEQAIASGVTSVRHSDGKEVRYRSISDLIKARDIIAASLSGKRGYRKRTLQVNVDSNLGSFGDNRNRDF